MNSLRKGLWEDDRGVEPTVMKILVGIILIAIGLGVGVTVYQEFGGAAKSYLDYSVTANPSSNTIQTGGSDTVSISIDTNVDFNKEVNLRATGIPDGVSVSFSPTTGNPSFGSTMSVEVAETAEAKTHTITIKASSEDGERTSTYRLTVE